MSSGISQVCETSSSQRAEAVHLEDIRKSYGPVEVLKGVSLKAYEGDVVAMIGASGSGKSTFLRCANLLEIPNSGRVVIGKEDIKLVKGRDGAPRVLDQKQLQRVRCSLSMVFQSFNLWPHRTILENIIEAPVYILGEKRADALAHAEQLLERVGLYAKKNAFPAHLSGGQQQRAAIARALAVRPRVMLFDEPTSALDPELVAEVLKVIRSIATEGRTMLLVTHEMAFAREVANHVMFLHDGRVVEEGPPDEIFVRPQSERFQKFLGSRHT